MTTNLFIPSLRKSSGQKFARYCFPFLAVLLIYGCKTTSTHEEPKAAARPEGSAPEYRLAPVAEAAPAPAAAPAPIAMPAPAPAAKPAPAPLVAFSPDGRSVSLASKSPPKKARKSSSPELVAAMKAEARLEGQSSQPEAISKDKFEKVKAELAATPVITTPGPPGDLRVWIGDTGYQANFPPGMNVASAVIPTSIKPQTVLVTPNAPAFNIDPQNMCQRFDPTGTTANFQLMPKYERNETYSVGARIEIFDQDNCKGDPIPKAAADIRVRVEVKILPPENIFQLLRKYSTELIGGLLSLAVAFMLFRARKFLKEKFGFEDKGK